ncbi:MAG: RNA polymerase factor sigma-54 [Desulfatiglandales bacterium]
MGLELRQDLKLTQQLVMTPLLQQAIKLLQLSRLELIETVREELETNPVLEDESLEPQMEEGLEDRSFDSDPDISTQQSLSSERAKEGYENLNWEEYAAEYSYGGDELREDREELPGIEATATKEKDLKDHLLWQLGMTNLSEGELKIGDYIIGNLNEDGYLEITVEEIAQALSASKEEVERVLSIIQNFDPVGVAGRNLKETLLIQVRFYGYEETLLERLIENHLEDLGDKNYERIMAALGIDKEELSKTIRLLQTLDPKPGRNYSNERPSYITPDVYVVKVGNDYQIILNEDGLPKLRISRYYQDVLANRIPLPEPEREYIREKIKNASWLIKSIHQRQKTLYKVTESIMKFQREFLEKGIKYLKPLVLRDVAEDINMHESTVSRITTNKYVHTPQGIFELKYFFNSSVGMVDGNTVASESVKELIRNIIKNEDKSRPLTDQEIAEILLKHNIRIARRTVAKYREAMGILPSKQRIELV